MLTVMTISRPQMYEEMLKCAKKNHCDLVMCDCMKVYWDGGGKRMYSLIILVVVFMTKNNYIWNITHIY